MRMMEFSEFNVEPGLVTVWTATAPRGAGGEVTVGQWSSPSYNQQARVRESVVRAESEDWPRRWSVSTARIRGRADPAALESAYARFIQRHGTLLSGFTENSEEVRRYSLAPHHVTLERRDVGRFTTRHEVLTRLERLFDESIHPLKWPAYLFGVVVGEASSTLFMAFDHIHVDLQSHALAVHEVQSLYTAQLEGQEVNLPPPGNYIVSSSAERRFDSASSELDEAVDYWTDFTWQDGGGMPSFPLDLGVPADAPLPLHTGEFLLLDDTVTRRFDRWCWDNRCTFLAGLLAAAGLTAHKMAGVETFRTVIPVRTRNDPTGPAIGWFVNGVPIEFKVAAQSTLGDVMTLAQGACLSAHRHASVPYERVLQLLPTAVSRAGASWFSYLDFRVFPGATSHGKWRAAILIRSGVGSGVDLWVNRSFRGTFIHVRYPRTPATTQLIQEYVRLMRATVTGILHD